MFQRNFDDPIPAFWDAHNAADRREIPGREITGGHAIGRDHEVLDDLPGTILCVYFQRADLIAVEYGPGFICFQTQRPVSVTEILHLLGCPILETQIFIQAFHSQDGLRNAAGPLQPGSHAVISELGMIGDAGLVDIRILKSSRQHQ